MENVQERTLLQEDFLVSFIHGVTPARVLGL